jgi:uncharacterized protein (TIGR00725 family)
MIALASELGRLIAQRGWVLVNGGRSQGVTGASARGAKEAGGTVIGILPDSTTRRASPHLDYAIVTGMGDGRNLVNVLSCDVVIACPGRLGTLSEVIWAVKYRKPTIVIGLDPGPELDGFRRKGLLQQANSPCEAVEMAAGALRQLGFT